MDEISKRSISETWDENAGEWIRLIKEKGIPSRKVTDNAIVDTILDYHLKIICDVGCGEGWLVRELIDKGLNADGVDGAAELIFEAKKHRKGGFAVQDFDEIITGKKLYFEKHEAAVLNFCLYENEKTEYLLSNLSENLIGQKLIFIQSLHPLTILKMEKTYTDQWLIDSWKGLKGTFTSTHSWYYRTFSGWLNLFEKCKLKVVEVREPVSNEDQTPLSIIFVLKAN